jgi:Fe-S-cluster containining protein
MDLRYKCLQCGGCCSLKEDSVKKRIPLYPDEVDSLIKIAEEKNLSLRVIEDLVFPDILNKTILVITYRIILKNQNNRCPFYKDELGCSIHDKKPLACQAYPLSLKQIDAFNFQISIDPLCNYVKKNYNTLKLIDINDLRKVFGAEYKKAKNHLNRNKSIIIKIKELENFGKIKIGRNLKIENFNKYLKEWKRVDLYVE